MEKKTKRTSKGVKSIKTASEKKDDKIIENSLTAMTTDMLHSPYTNTIIINSIYLSCKQMNNDIYLNIKNNLKRLYNGKCLEKFGCIIKINTVEECSDGLIEAEDMTCSARFVVKFNCRLCLPMKGRDIICVIDKIVKQLFSAKNGPITIIGDSKKINEEIFYIDSEEKIRLKQTSMELVQGMHIRVKILTYTFTNYEETILSISYLKNIATEEEIAMYEKDQSDNKENENKKFEESDMY